MRSTNYRAAIARMGRCCKHFNSQPAARSTRPQVAAMASRVARVFDDDPAAALALELAGADALGTLLRMRAAATDPRMAAMMRGAR